MPPEALANYLDRHTGDDALIEKALLAIVQTSYYGPKSSFGDVLNRHSDPDRAVRAMTHDFRRLLGGKPATRERWALEVLALPNHDAQLIRALPAWTALKLSGARPRGYI